MSPWADMKIKTKKSKKRRYIYRKFGITQRFNIEDTGKLLIQSLEWLFQILSKCLYPEDLSDVNFSYACIKHKPGVNL